MEASNTEFMSEDTDVSPAIEDAARRLAEPGVLTERQALAWVLRAAEGVPREEAADRMGVAVSTLDALLGRARRKLVACETTLERADDLGGRSR